MVNVYKYKNNVVVSCQEPSNNFDFYISKYEDNDENIDYMIKFVRYEREEVVTYPSGEITNSQENNKVFEIFLNTLLQSGKTKSFYTHSTDKISMFLANLFNNGKLLALLTYRMAEVDGLTYKKDCHQEDVSYSKIQTLFSSLMGMASECDSNEYLFPIERKSPDELDTYLDLCREKANVINPGIEKALHIKRLTAKKLVS